MRIDLAVIALTLFSTASAAAVDAPREVKRVDIQPRADEHELWKRRGGGGGGGRGGGGGSSGGSGKSGSSGSGSSGSGSRGSSGSSGSGSRGSGGYNRNVPGAAYGSSRSFGGGRFYGGGAASPYSAGRKSPAGILPVFLIGGALLFWPGVWLGSHAYTYPYDNTYRFYNETSEKNETRDVICGCAEDAECACDEPKDKDERKEYLDDLIGNGSYAALPPFVTVAEVNGTDTILINGTIDKTDTDSADSDSDSAAVRHMVEALGFWPAVAAVGAAVYLI